MIKKEMIAMLLAGGQGSRLGVLTANVAKPAVAFGGKYRIIDFPLSNCINSGVDTVGVLTQYQPLKLNTHIGIGIPWDLDRNVGGVSVLPPYEKSTSSEWYTGTANAIYQNLRYMEYYNPDYVLILSGDHEVHLVKTDDAWTESSLPDETIKESTVNTLLNEIANITTTETVVEAPEDLSQYGLEEPFRTITAVLSDGTQVVIYAGNKSDLLSEYYIKVEGDDNVYLVSSNIVTDFDKDPEDFIDETETETATEETADSADETAATDAIEETAAAKTLESTDGETESADAEGENAGTAGETETAESSGD